MNYTSGHEQHAVIVLLYLSEVEIPQRSAGFGEMGGGEESQQLLVAHTQKRSRLVKEERMICDISPEKSRT